MMPGTGEGKAPPLIGILQKYGYAPLVLLTAAAMVPGTFGNGIAIIGKNLEASFHIHNTAPGRDRLRGPGGPAAVGGAPGPPGRPGQPQAGGRRGTVRLRRLRLADGDLAQRVGLRLLVPGGVGGLGGEQHRPQLVSVRRLPDREPRAHLQLAQPGHTALGHGRDPLLRLHRHRRPQLALRPAGGSRRHPPQLRPPHHSRARQGGQRGQPHPQVLGHGRPVPAGEGAPGAPGAGGHPPAADPLPLLRAHRRGHPGLRRHRGPALRQPLLLRQVPPRRGRAQRGLRHHRPGRLPGAAGGLRGG